MRLENEQYEEIKRVAIDTFSLYGIRCIPISAFEMATKIGIKIVPYSALNEEKRIAAMRESKDGFSIGSSQSQEWIIFYNDSCESYGRINQTIMHEIGHYAMGHIKDGEEEEAEANFFAKYALAPPPLIDNFIENVTPDAIRTTFDLSNQAAKYAYWYYRSWLYNGIGHYTDYEEKMLDLFKAV